MGIRALNAPVGFPIEATTFPRKVWVVSHKPVAVAAGLGQMGIHGNGMHPRFGSFILLGTVLLAAEVDEQSQPVVYDPCVSCTLYVTACRVGAIKADGHFDTSACLTTAAASWPGSSSGCSSRSKSRRRPSPSSPRPRPSRTCTVTPDCTIRADAATWLGFVHKERSILWAILRGKIRVIGGLAKLRDFGRCLPG